jgi:hypothetical protein
MTLKSLRLPDDAEDGLPSHAIREISLLRELQHENIVRCSRTLSLRYPVPILSFAARTSKCSVIRLLSTGKTAAFAGALSTF